MATRRTSGQAGPVRRIVVVDDHPLIRQGVREAVAGEADLDVCGEADGVEEALAVVERADPDLAVVDLSLKDGSGLDLIRALRERHPDVRVLVLSMRDEGFYAERAFRAGARGYLNKQEAPGKLVSAMRKVLEGEIYASAETTARVMTRIARGRRRGSGARRAELTHRELAVLELIGAGLPMREVAQRLQISPSTVDSHREHIKAKLKLDGAAALLRYAIQWVHSRQGM